MKKKLRYILFVFALLFVGGSLSDDASAQHYIGIRGGYGGGTSRIYTPRDMQTIWGLYHGGVSWKYFTKERYVGGTQVDLLYMQQGYRENSPRFSVDFDQEDSTGYYKRKVNTIMVPIFWQPHAYMFQRKMRVFLNLGVTFSYVLSQTEETGSDLNGVFEKGDYKMKTTRDNRWGYGLCGGGGVGWSFGRFEVLGEVRYYIGYSDIMKNKNKYETNPLRSPLDGLQASLGVYYRFGKHGILSKPSPKVEAKMMEADLRRLEKIEAKRAKKNPEQEQSEDLETNEEVVDAEGVESEESVDGVEGTEGTEIVPEPVVEQQAEGLSSDPENEE